MQVTGALVEDRPDYRVVILYTRVGWEEWLVDPETGQRVLVVTFEV